MAYVNVKGTFKDDRADYDLVSYITNRGHAISGYIGARGVAFMDESLAQDVAYQFQIVRSIYGKNDGKRMWHLLVSFAPHEDIYPSEALQVGYNVIEKFFSEHQCVFAVHENTNVLHLHFAISSINYCTGKRLNISYSMQDQIKWATTKAIEDVQFGKRYSKQAVRAL